jgi:hypothetical protein
MHCLHYKQILNLLFSLMLVITSSNSHAQYIIEGAKYRSIRDSLIGNEKSQLQKDPINSISLSYELAGLQSYINYQQLPWKNQIPLLSNYQGRKIKKLFVQHDAGKVVIIFKGADSLAVTEDEAIKEGLLPKSTFSANEITKIDTQLYAGSIIPIHIKLQDPENSLVSRLTLIKPTGTAYDYELESYIPGDVWIMEKGTDGLIKKVYAYNLLPDPEQYHTKADFFAGGINSLMVDYNFFKKLQEVTVSSGYRFSSGTIYFTEIGSLKMKSVTLSSPSLLPAKYMLDLCLPGSTVTFDSVTLTDSTGEKIVLLGKSYYLIDKDDIRTSYAGLITNPYFEKGILNLYKDVTETLIRLPYLNLTKGKFDFDFSFIVESDGSLSDIYKIDFSGKEEIFRACYNLVKNSNKWIPGTYKGNPIKMPLENLRFSIEIK